MAGLLHRNVIACGFTDKVQLLISSSVAASVLFQDDSLTMGPHRYDAHHGRASLGRWLTRYRRASLVDVSMALDQAVTRVAERS